jgi:hypothetical protein
MASADLRDILPEIEASEAASVPPTPRGGRRRRSIRDWLRKNNDDNLTTMLLAAAALATSWGAYQASLWGGVQAAHYTLANDTRTEALGAADSAARLRLVDFALFANWLDAYADHRDQIRRFYEARFRPEFQPAFRAWSAKLPSLDSTTSSPFDEPEYHVAAATKASKLHQLASSQFQAGQRANAYSDAYVFDTVLLALVLFFASTARQIVSSRARAFIILVAFLLFVWSVVRLIRTPVAS